MACLDLQDTLAFGLSVYHQIAGAESAWYASVDAGQIPFDETEETAFGHLYALWLLPPAIDCWPRFNDLRTLDSMWKEPPSFVP